MLQQRHFRLALVSVLLLASGCVYRQAIQQGNFLEPASVKQLQVGMTRSQVRFLLGTPMLPDAFDKDRWDYVYYLQTSRRKPPEQWRLTVWFEGDVVSRFENAGVPEPRDGSAAAGDVKTAALSPPCRRRWYWPVGCKS
ncbi:MAG: outer membrane protein assembly factor BamE [Steroidobacteraceae bacterium]|nr:outer membrane protein assembly factor BamE [Steroidobacteraceae bacterium]MDW8259928.1 outer membrane protein assembly factor BamE [Gammaproteobacteria bacterium]